MSRKAPGLVRWYGGKGRLLSHILPMIPNTRVYVEPYGGAASILLNRKTAPVEVYNDLDGRLVNFMRVMQSPEQFRLLLHRLRHTPYSRAEFARALGMQAADDPVDRAWAFFVVQNQGFSGKAGTIGNFGRVFVARRGMSHNCSFWQSRIAALRHQRDRIMSVQVDNRDALEVIRYWDSEDTTFYLDPPYVSHTRSKGSRSIYTHEMSDSQHRELVQTISQCQGCVVLSGYDSPTYAPLIGFGWRRDEFYVTCDAAGRVRGSKLRGKGAVMRHAPRVEVVWRNPACLRWGRLFSD